MPNTFFIGDTHFEHESILYHCNRPWPDVESMNEALAGNWNSIVSKKDTVYILGDFCWKNHNRWIMRLNGTKHLIMGNHDRMSKECYSQLIDGTSYDYLKNFTSVFITTKMIQLNGHMYFLSHYCNRIWPQGHYGARHLFAHSHGRLTTFNMSVDVGIDTELANYAPIPLENIEKEMERREEMMERAGRINHKGRPYYSQDDVYWMIRNTMMNRIRRFFRKMYWWIRNSLVNMFTESEQE